MNPRYILRSATAVDTDAVSYVLEAAARRLIESEDGMWALAALMTAAIAGKRQEGIHVGPHGQLMRSVAEFRVEIFREIQVA
jgi:hypothetical protein